MYGEMSTVEKIRPYRHRRTYYRTEDVEKTTIARKMSKRLIPYEFISIGRNVKKIRLTSYEGRNVRRNVEKMRLLSNELRNVWMIYFVQYCTNT